MDIAAFFENEEFGVTELDFTQTVEYGTTIINGNSIYTRVRGGGIGSRASVQQIVGLRSGIIDWEFVERSEEYLSRSGASGTIHWSGLEDGVYALQNFCVSSSRAESHVVVIFRGEVAEVPHSMQALTGILAPITDKRKRATLTEGSSKQRAWACTIREQMIARAESDELPATVIDGLLSETDAILLIDKRYASSAQLEELYG